MIYLLSGTIIGLFIGVSVGPNAILCLHRSMAHGAWAGISTGIGASIAHIVFAAIAIFGMHFVQPFFDAYGEWIRLIGSLIILMIAIHIGRTPVEINDEKHEPMDHDSALLTSFLITLSGPLSIASYAIFIGMVNIQISTLFASVQFLIGVFAGNLIWWIPLSIASSYLYTFLKSKYVRYIDLGAAVMLATLALFGITTSLYQIMQ